MPRVCTAEAEKASADAHEADSRVPRRLTFRCLRAPHDAGHVHAALVPDLYPASYPALGGSRGEGLHDLVLVTVAHQVRAPPLFRGHVESLLEALLAEGREQRDAVQLASVPQDAEALLQERLLVQIRVRRASGRVQLGDLDAVAGERYEAVPGGPEHVELVA